MAYLYPLRAPIVVAWLLMSEFRRSPLFVFLGNVADALRRRISAAPENGLPPVALRELLSPVPKEVETASERAMAALRAGR